MRRRILVTSDHHAGARYSTIEENIETLATLLHELNNARDVDERICVFDGDMFEIEEGLLNRPMMMDRAITMMRAYLQAFPSVRFVYTLGNHEDFRVFHEQLEALAEEYPGRFAYTPDFYQVDDILCTHGDLPITSRGGPIADKRLPGGFIWRADRGFRELDEGEHPWSYSVKTFLKGIINNLVAPVVFPFEKSVEDIISGFHAHMENFFQHYNIRHVVFGHIHSGAVHTDYRPDPELDVAFHVSGSAVNHAPHAIYQFTTEGGRTVGAPEVYEVNRRHLEFGIKEMLPADHLINRIVSAYEEGFFRDAGVRMAVT